MCGECDRPVRLLAVSVERRDIPATRNSASHRPSPTLNGIPFFEKLDRDIVLHLAEVKAYKSGIVELCYEVPGHDLSEDDNVKHGTMFEANNELALHVADPVSAAEFYAKALGCTVVNSDPNCVELTSGALRLFLLADPQPEHEPVVPSFSVPNRAAALEALQTAGCTLVAIGPHAPGEHYVREPNGILFDVVERQHM